MTGINILSIIKRETGESYSFFYDDREASFRELLAVFSRFADDPELSFTWHDAAILGGGVRKRWEEWSHAS